MEAGGNDKDHILVCVKHFITLPQTSASPLSPWPAETFEEGGPSAGTFMPVQLVYSECVVLCLRGKVVNF